MKPKVAFRCRVVQLLPLRLILVVALLAVAAPLAAGAHMADWAPLGALGPYAANALAVSSAWPADKTIVAVRGPDVIASRDGGAHGERRGLAPVPRHVDLTFADPHILLATTDEELFRSTDLGHTWSSTLVGSRASL